MQNFNGEALGFNTGHRLKRAIDQLLGICSGIVADGEINDTEIAFLSTWLTEHEEICCEFPANQISRRIKEIMADGVVSEDERLELLEVLQQISGNRFSDTGAAAVEEAAIKSDMVQRIEFEGRHFCFTGKFAYGTRKLCSDATTMRGGICDGDVTKNLDYLVLGVGVSKDWKHESYGRKIERALQIREDGGHRPCILNEADWVLAIK